MIFLDNTGKRWRRIKLGTGLLSTTTVAPIAALLIAALLYLPNWDNFSLPTALGGHVQEVKSAQTSQEPRNTTSTRQQSSTQSRTTSVPGPSLTNNSSPSSPGEEPVEPVTTPTAVAAPTDTPIQTGQGQGLVNQPEQTGNSDYGRSHQPTRS